MMLAPSIFRCWPILFFVGLLLTGCETRDWQSDTHPASGTIRINGQPPVGAVVELQAIDDQPDERNSRPWGIVDEQGDYALSTYEAGDGAPAGRYAVTIRWPPDVSQPSLADRLGGAYATPVKSEWTVTITEGENKLPAITIDGVAVEEKFDDGPEPPAGPMAAGQ